MSNREFQRQLDEQVFAALPEGMVSRGVLLPKDASADEPGAPCRGYVNVDTQTVGPAQQRSASNYEISLFLADAAPRQGMVYVVEGERYELQKRLGQDFSVSRWAAVLAPQVTGNG
ncbi:hypothetical protein [Pseudoxanthomonas winnipegensis]|uniref:Head-tail adaptor protein n=1 Tax=Pseudoxanthomonas winnipegensis TaxID=2480810 RepID=A0A4Q8M378_9GAMM|nr:hypothetical protein [Pseudoxanthomonas winnipegensis]TAA42472.1 hypothetical protein EA655_10600 [Pseudoxanthomonas winnipegensis]